MTIGDNLRFYMNRAQMGPRRLVRAARTADKRGRGSGNGRWVFGVSESYIFMLLANKRGHSTSGEVLSLLASVLGVTPEELMRDNPTATALADKRRREIADQVARRRRPRLGGVE